MTEQIERIKELFSTLTGWNILWCVLQILTLTVLFFLALRFLKVHRNAVALPWWLAGILLVFGVLFLFQNELPVLWKLALALSGVVLVYIVVLFAVEFRRATVKLAHGRKGKAFFAAKYDLTHDELRNTIAEIIRAVQNMSKKNVGALIVIAPVHIQSQILESGMALNALVSAPLLESIFNTKAPMHDGAVIVRANVILAAGCFLPLSQNTELPNDLGTRHRAALGVSEANDVLSVIVSEQTGIISVCKNGIISRYYNSEMLEEVLEQAYGLKLMTADKKNKRKRAR
ncbi:MAG: diadenylate cyclase [Clostridiales bacterium]|jgi:diadenylate cyclase|nr:diadenylate cyclase [Clostridiales bacterium]